MVKVKMFESQAHVDREALDMPALDADGFMEVVESRRSVRVFAKDPVPEEVVDACVRAAQLAPNSSNLQICGSETMLGRWPSLNVVGTCQNVPINTSRKSRKSLIRRACLLG